MPNVPIPVVGPTYTSRSTPISGQVTRGLYLEIDQQSETPAALVPFPGLKPWGSTGLGSGRGLGVFNNALYAVTGSSLYSVNSSGTPTSIGSINGLTRCSVEEATDTLVIANENGKPYTYNGSTLTQGTDTDLPSASSVTYIRNRVVYDGAGGNVAFADLGTPLTVSSSNVTSSDTKPDDTLAVKAFRDQLFVFSEVSITPYYNSGSGNPPYAVIQNAVQEVGLGAIHSIASNYRSLYFLGSDLMPYRIGGIQPEPIGNPAIGQAIQSYATKSDAYGVCFSFNNEYFYMLTFPGDATWLYSERAQSWTSLAYGQDAAPHLICDYAYCYGKHLVSSRLNGDIYELDFDTYTDNGESIDRQRDTVKVSGRQFGYPGKEIYMDRLELVVETGAGVITGQGSDPRVMMSYSDDGGRTWSPEQWGYIGQMGSFTYQQNPYWTDLGSFYERMFRFRVSDPIKFVIISCNADISVGS
jgi:hypothetical protein